MPHGSLHIARHQAALARAGLTTIEAIQSASGDLIKNHGGVRDVVRITVIGDAGESITLFLKRNLIPIRKHGWHGLLRHGRFVSSAELEWQNFARVAAAGVQTCAPVAWGATFGPVGETFSFVVTEAARGVELEHLARHERDRTLRHRGIAAVADALARLHAQGVGLPTLFARHVFLDLSAPAGTIAVTLIDLDRIATPLLMGRRRARDLAQLHLSVPRTAASRAERLRFVRAYAGTIDRALLGRVARLTCYLERRKPNLAATYHSA